MVAFIDTQQFSPTQLGIQTAIFKLLKPIRPKELHMTVTPRSVAFRVQKWLQNVQEDSDQKQSEAEGETPKTD